MDDDMLDSVAEVVSYELVDAGGLMEEGALFVYAASDISSFKIIISNIHYKQTGSVGTF